MSEVVGVVEEQTVEVSTDKRARKRAMGLSRRAIVSIVLAATFAAYIGTIGYQFVVYDDQDQIVKNPLIQSWSYAPRYFTEHVWSHIYPNGAGNYYRPVFLLWLLINQTLFGLQ